MSQLPHEFIGRCAGKMGGHHAAYVPAQRPMTGDHPNADDLRTKR
jgi:hypothetical protein